MVSNDCWLISKVVWFGLVDSCVVVVGLRLGSTEMIG